MAEHLSELCSILVEDAFGNLASQIFDVLALYGRSSLTTIRNHTQLADRELKIGTATLIQQHLIYVHCPDDESPAFFQVNWESAYGLIRSGKFIVLVEDRLGEGAGHLLGNLLQIGHASVGDLAEAYDFSPTSKRDSGYQSIDGGDATDSVTGTCINGSRKKIASLSQFHSALRKLLKAGFVTKMADHSMTPPTDIQLEIEEKILSENYNGKVSGSRQQADFKNTVKGEKKRVHESIEYNEFRDRDSKGGVIKRESFAPNKRVKLNGNVTNGFRHHEELDEEVDVVKLPSDMIVQVNLTKCTHALRSQQLQLHAASHLGHVPGEVYGALLQCIEAKLPAFSDDQAGDEDSDDDEADQSPTATVLEIAEVLDPHLDLQSGFKLHPTSSYIDAGTTKKRPRAVEKDEDYSSIGIKREPASDDDDHDMPGDGYSGYADKNKRLRLIEQHLLLLQEHPRTFCTKAGNLGKSEWRVHFTDLTKSLIEGEVDRVICARLGRVAARTCRLLREKGKMHDEHISLHNLLGVKEMRKVLGILSWNGFLEAQELPKDNGRHPMRSLYFWYFDTHRVQHQVLHQSYQAMARCLRRIRVEREKYKTIIEKASNPLMGENGEHLSAMEKNTLRRWYETEDKLLTQVMRMDTSVGILRDFHGGSLAV